MTQPSPSASAQPSRFDRRRALRTIGLSLAINAGCPFLAYRLLQSHFPPDSVVPLLCAMVFPVAGLLLSVVNKRTMDVVAIIAMVAIAAHVAITLIARSVGIALVAISLDGALIGLVLVVSALIGRPLILTAVKQAAAGGGAERVAALERLIETDGQRAFFTVTLVWGLCLMAMSGLHVVLALTLAPADFLLVSPIVGVITILALIVWTGRYLAVRLGRLTPTTSTP